MPSFDPERHARPLSIAGTAAVVAGLYSGADLGWAAAAVGVALLLTACYSRQDGFLLFGPFARADAVRSARSRRTHLVRAGIALAAGAVIVFNGEDFLPRYLTQWSRNRQSQYINSQIIGWFAVGVGLLVPSLTVLLVSGAIAEERAAKRWEVLLTTDLRGRELVFGKLLGKLWLVVEPVVVILPVLAMLPLIVGLSPAVMLLFGGATFVTMLALAGLAAWASAASKGRSGAAGFVVVVTVGYLWLSTGLLRLSIDVPKFGAFPRFQGYAAPAVVADLVEAFNAANPFAALMLNTVAGPALAGYAAALRQYSAGALGVFLVGTLLACQRVRTVRDPDQAEGLASRPLRLLGRGKRRESLQERRARLRPPVTDEPLAWWARCRVGVFRAGPMRPRSVAIAFGVCVAVFLASYAIDLVGQGTLYPWLRDSGLRVYDWLASATVLGLVSFAVPIVCAITLIVPVISATQSIAKERSGDTLESLRLTPLTAREMLEQIRDGCLQTNRLFVLWWATPTAAAVVTGFFPLHVAVLLLAMALVLASPLVNFALYCSAWASTPARAARNLIFGGAVGHYALLLAGGAVFLGIPSVLGFDRDLMWLERQLLQPDEFVLFRTRNMANRSVPTLARVALTLGMYGGGVALYWLLGRWVFSRAVGRFAKSRDATA